jgi:hypothetical protein
MLEDCIGSQGPQRTVVLGEEEWEENKRKNEKKGCDVVWSGRHLPTFSDGRYNLL